MRSIRLDEWALTILNETIRADAEFQINQRSAWQEFARTSDLFNGVDISAGFQRQRSLLMHELTFEFALIPDIPGFWDKVFHLFWIRRIEPGSYYRVRKAGEVSPAEVNVKMVICRDAENRYRSEVKIDPENSMKPKDIHVVDIAR
jgi:hypothetical protein